MPKIRIVFFVFCILFAAIVVKLFTIQILRHGVSLSNAITKFQRIQPARGKILDRNGDQLVSNQTTYLLFAEPKKISNTYEVVHRISDVLQMDTASIEARLDPTKDWVSIRAGITEEQKKRLTQKTLEGLGFEPRPTRFYPEGSLSSQLVGFVGKNDRGDDIGYFGVEGFYNKDLAGLPGIISMAKDVLGRPALVGNYEKIDGENGSDLTLTIDKSVQEIAKRKLKAGIETYEAKEGCVLIADPQTMEMLAITCLPDFDPEKYYQFDEKFFTNQAITSLYEPGSIFKPLIVAAALEEKKIKPDTEFVEGGPIQVGEYQIRTWNNKYEDKLSVTGILERSSNVGMVKIGEKLGKNNIYNYLIKYGFNEPTNVDLQGEAAGYIKPKSQWYTIDYSTATFGQGIAVTPIGMLRAFASVINGGKLLQPYVVREIGSGEDKRVREPKVIRNVLSAHTSSLIREMLVSTVEHGEYRYAAPVGYKIGGKTGTAQIALQGKYDASKTIASFIGFAPADKPRFLALVMIKEPGTSIYGSETAAPLFFEIAKELLYYYNISPQ